jgi:hypothetical protein
MADGTTTPTNDSLTDSVNDSANDSTTQPDTEVKAKPKAKPKAKAKPANAERTKIDVNDADDMRFWTEKYGVTAIRIKDAVGSVGNSATKVEQYLKK